MSDVRKAPEMPPEYPPETTGTRWLPIAAVGVLLQKRERNTRYWLDRHSISSRGERPKLFAETEILAALARSGQPHREAPEHPPEATGTFSEPPPESAGMSSEPIEGVYRVLPEDIERAIARTGERYVGDIQTVFDRVAALYDQRLGEKDALIATVRGEKDALIAELRRRAEVAEAERDALRAQAAPAAPGSSAAPTPDNPTRAPSAGFWARVRRVFGGE